MAEKLLYIGDGGVYPTDAYAGMPGDGSTDERAALDNFFASTMPATGGRAMLALGTHVVGSALTIPKSLVIPEGATIRPASGVTVTLERVPEAGRYQVFDLSAGGTVTCAADVVGECGFGE